MANFSLRSTQQLTLDSERDFKTRLHIASLPKALELEFHVLTQSFPRRKVWIPTTTIPSLMVQV